ncbi:MAG: lipid-A-disaccharide synthase [Verrucomicrobiota bacterium]
MKTLYIVAGEISGDTHASALLRELGRLDDWRFTGLGGPAMHEVSGAIENWLEEAAVLGLVEVLRKYSYFRDKLSEATEAIVGERPDGVVLVDYPGFNLRLAKQLRGRGFEGKILYYISPQVWAWKKGRIRKMAKILDLMICIFPFEKDLYEKSGLATVFSGHPLVDEMKEIRDPGIKRVSTRVALLPGSREREIEALFPPMVEAARELAGAEEELLFCTTGATEKLTKRLEEIVGESGLDDRFEIGKESSHEIMQRCGVGVVASGTATLEAACLGLPYCLTYRVAWLTAWVARRLMSVDYLGIVNVLAGREVVTELLQERASGPELARALRELLEDDSKRIALESELEKIVSLLGEGGAHRNAAAAIQRQWS